MALFAGLLALLSANSPPVTVPDARFSVAVWCLPTCDDDATDALRDALSEGFTLRRALARRGAEGPQMTFRVEDAAAVGLYPPEALDAVAPSLDAPTRERLGLSQEVVIIAGAAPGGPKFYKRLGRLNQLVGEFASKAGAVVEDIDTREIYSAEAWTALRADALLRADPLLWEQFALLWTPDGDRVVTLGLRKFGLHELSIRGLSPQLADDALATLVLAAQTGWEKDFHTNDVELRVDSIRNESARYWLEQWVVRSPGAEGRAGSGVMQVRLRNTPPWPGDPGGPILELVLGDSPKAIAEALDATWGYGASPMAVPVGEPMPEPMILPEAAQPAGGWSGQP